MKLLGMGLPACDFWRKSRTKCSFWRLFLTRKSHTKRSIRRLDTCILEEVLYETQC